MRETDERGRGTGNGVLLAGTVALYAGWLALHIRDLTGVQDGILRFALGHCLALLLLLRPPADNARPADRPPGWVLAGLGMLGALVCIGGLLWTVRQFEWLGLILLVAAALRHGLPGRFAANVFPACLLAYWVHPLPSQVFLPMQTGIQTLSVRGSEWLLHMLNQRVWADGPVLLDGFQTFEVPFACGGLRAATTVFLLAIGLSLWKRFRGAAAVGLVLLSLLQALALNILRITLMVMVSPPGTNLDSTRFLHDTTGLLLLAAVLLTWGEIALADAWRRRQRVRRREPGTVRQILLTLYPRFWRLFHLSKWALIPALLFAGLVGGLVFKSRPFHRADMIKSVAERLRDNKDLENAQRAADAVLQWVPWDGEWDLSRIQILMMRGRNEDVLAGLDALLRREPHRVRDMEPRILKAYANLGLGRMDVAAALIAELPAPAFRDPRVAMVLADIAYSSNDPDSTATNVILASRWYPNLTKIRALYPYLERNRRWYAIAESDQPFPFTDPETALAAAAAHMNLDHVPRVGEIIRQALADWPDDPRLLIPLFYLSMKLPGGIWEKRLAVHFAASLQAMRQPDQLYELFPRCVQLGRPDLLWLLYRRIEEIDPGYPGLRMAAVRYGDQWFLCRNHAAGIPSEAPYESTDLRPFFLQVRRLSRTTWKKVCHHIPLADELVETDGPRDPRPPRLEKALAAFRARDQGVGLTVPMQFEQAEALEMAGRLPEACRTLEQLRRDNPAQAPAVRTALSGLYARQGDWQNLYETLRGYADEPDAQMTPMLRLQRAQTQLQLGLGAVHTGRRAYQLFPESTRGIGALASALATFDSPEEALQVLSRPRVFQDRSLDLLEAMALQNTERYQEAQRFCTSHLIPRLAPPADRRQAYNPAEAERTLRGLDGLVPPDAEFDKTAAEFRKNLSSARSPFLAAYFRLWLDCHGGAARGPAADPTRWIACGRNAEEQATALHQLALLLCRHRQPERAREVLHQAARRLPESGLLWRFLIRLSNGDPTVAAEARAACPTDSEVFLAALVTGLDAAADPGAWALQEIETATKSGTCSPVAMVRAGEFLLRRGHRAAAFAAAREAGAHARGYLPASVFAVRCALLAQDRDWALHSVEQAIEAALDPPPVFYEKLVQIKAATDSTDGEMVHALRNLRRFDPKNPLWAQMQGYVRFRRGGLDTPDALRSSDEAIENGATNLTPYLLSAEASRLLGNPKRAAETLQRARQLFPGSLLVLNNLAFSLASDPESAREALPLLPDLLRQGNTDPGVLDTIALVYLRTGDLDRAEETLKKLDKTVVPDSPLAFRARLHAAEITLRRGKPDKTVKALEALLDKRTGVHDEDVFAANRLLEEAREARRREKRGKK